MNQYFVRCGALAEVRRIEMPVAPSRGQRVVVRTDRGVEIAEVVAPSAIAEASGSSVAPKITFLRNVTQQDEMLRRRLEKDQRAAIESCRDKLTSLGSESMLLDIDPLFDGMTLIFHFLGPVDDVAKNVTAELIESYESVSGMRKVAELLTVGCGPGCGTAAGGDSGGCGSGCAGCAVGCK